MHLPTLQQLDPTTLHHAYIAAAKKDSVHNLRNWITTLPNSAIVVMEHQTFGIDDAHHLTKLVPYATGNESRFFIIVVDAITREAQNALLKLLEEPVAGVHFFILVPTFDSVLPTILSRTQRITLAADEDAASFDARAFIAATPSDRMKTIESLLKKTEEGDASKIAIMRTVVESIEDLIRTDQAYKKPARIQALAFIRNYQTTQGASHKMLLEYLALTI